MKCKWLYTEDKNCKEKNFCKTGRPDTFTFLSSTFFLLLFHHHVFPFLILLLIVHSCPFLLCTTSPSPHPCTSSPSNPCTTWFLLLRSCCPSLLCTFVLHLHILARVHLHILDCAFLPFPSFTFTTSLHALIVNFRPSLLSPSHPCTTSSRSWLSFISTELPSGVLVQVKNWIRITRVDMERKRKGKLFWRWTQWFHCVQLPWQY